MRSRVSLSEVSVIGGFQTSPLPQTYDSCYGSGGGEEEEEDEEEEAVNVFCHLFIAPQVERGLDS